MMADPASSMSLGFPGRSAATEAPGPDDLLPTDDALWDQGVGPHAVSASHANPLQKKRGLLFTLSSPANANMGSFARLAKATYLLCHVLDHHVAKVDETSMSDAAKQLDQDLRALISLPDVEGQTKGVGGSPPTAFCYRYIFPRLQELLVVDPGTVHFSIFTIRRRAERIRILFSSPRRF